MHLSQNCPVKKLGVFRKLSGKSCDFFSTFAWFLFDQNLRKQAIEHLLMSTRQLFTFLLDKAKTSFKTPWFLQLFSEVFKIFSQLLSQFFAMKASPPSPPPSVSSPFCV